MQRKRCTTKEPQTSQKNQNHPPDTKMKLKSATPKVAIFLRRILLRSLGGKRNHRRVRRILPRLAHSYFSIVRTKINSSTTLTHHPLIVSHLEVIISMVNKMLAVLRIQSIQLKTANPRFFHTISVSMLGIMNSTPTHPKNHGRHPPQMVCHYPIPTHSGPRIQFIQLRTAHPKSCHITREITLSTMNNTSTLLRNLGRPTHQMECH